MTNHVEPFLVSADVLKEARETIKVTSRSLRRLAKQAEMEAEASIRLARNLRALASRLDPAPVDDSRSTG